MASITARSAAGSLMRTPPTALTNTSWSMQATPAWRCSTASSIASRSRSRPTDRRRGLGPPLSTSAWISTSIGRVPSSVTSTTLPGTGSACWLRKIALGIGHALQAALGHREHADLVDRAEAVLDGAHQAKARMRVALEVQHRVDHVLQHARAGQRALLGDVAHQHHRRAAGLGEAREVRRAFAHLRHRAGRRGELVGIDGLDRIDHRDRRARGVERGQDLLQLDLGQHLHLRAARGPRRRERSATWAPLSSPVT